MIIAQRIGRKIKRKAIYAARDIGHALGLDERFFREARGSRILIYHGICQTDHTRFNPIFLTVNTFEEHLRLYKEYFNIVSLDDYYNERFNNDRFNVCITFDDGYANNHQYVLYLLDKYEVPATFFITAIREAGYDILWNDFLGIVGKYGPEKLIYKDEPFRKGGFNKYISEKSGESLVEMLRSGGFDVKAEMMKAIYPLVPFKESKPADEDYWLQMTREQIRELSASPLVTIGSHGYYHNDMARIPLSDAIDEMTRSKQYLENIIGHPVKSLAFPYGSYDLHVVEAAKKCGYTQLLAMDYNYTWDHADEAMRERFTVNPFISPANQVRATITRRYE